MVFVHARNSTVRTANVLKDIAGMNNELNIFTDMQKSSDFGIVTKNVTIPFLVFIIFKLILI